MAYAGDVKQNTNKMLAGGAEYFKANPAATGLAVVAILAIVAAGYFYKQYNDVKANPAGVAQAENRALVAEVGRLIQLPTDEEPTIATVTDPEALRTQAFFAKAKVGDKVLIYTNAKKAILYDPVAKKIVEVAPVNIGSQQATP